ncbi:hypothetical protein XENTR_v10007661 [Xenopus tropicalis]|nr:hypothetical protein XENTR_v10007661 [Xenopus tropicalis]
MATIGRGQVGNRSGRVAVGQTKTHRTPGLDGSGRHNHFYRALWEGGGHSFSSTACPLYLRKDHEYRATIGRGHVGNRSGRVAVGKTKTHRTPGLDGSGQHNHVFEHCGKVEPSSPQ